MGRHSPINHNIGTLQAFLKYISHGKNVMGNKINGNSTVSAEWYTPRYFWDKILNTFNADTVEDIFDPCPIGGKDGLAPSARWQCHKYIYCNPPSPAKQWAQYAVDCHEFCDETNIIFASFSESTLWQCPKLLRYPTVLISKRIKWIDGRQYASKPNGDTTEVLIDGKILYPNTCYMRESKAPICYSAFTLLSIEHSIVKRFIKNFGTEGTILKADFLYP